MTELYAVQFRVHGPKSALGSLSNYRVNWCIVVLCGAGLVSERRDSVGLQNLKRGSNCHWTEAGSELG